MYTAVYKKVRSGYIAWIEEIPGVSTQGTSKRDAQENLHDALNEFILARKALTRKEVKGTVVRERFSFPR